MVPSTYEDGTLYNVLPSGNKAPDKTGNHNGYDQTRADFTFSRGSNLSATRIGPSGLIEKGRANYILYSQEFDNAYWNKLGVSITANQTTAPDGTLTADLLDDGTSTGNKFIEENEVIGGGVASMSIHAKYVDTQYLVLAAYDTSYKAAAFDILNGTLGNSDSALIPAIEDLGDGWYRCSIAYPGNTRNDPYISIGIREDNVATLPNQTGANRQVYIWGAQLENGLVATDYIETGSVSGTAGVLENTPRIDYSSGAGSLKLEPQRTNKFTHSEYIGSSDWLKSGNGSGSAPIVTTNYATSPEGVQNATRVQFDAVGTASTDRSTLAQRFAFTTGDVYTLSCWVKATSGSSTMFHMRINGAQVGGEKIATDEWQLFTETHTATATTTDDYGLQIRGNYSSNTSDILIYGMQLENASFGSSYVPTYGSAATRGADACSVTGASDVIGQTEGTLYADFIFDGKPTSIDYNIMILGAIGSNYINIGGYNTSLYARVFNSTLQGTINALQMVAGTRYKVAVAYANNDVVMYVNGANEGTDTSASIPAVSQIGFSRPSFEAKTNILNAQVYKERLTNSELATLTTL